MQPRTYKFNNSTLRVFFGNILESKAEVIVSSDDNQICAGGGVSRAILLHGGEIIQQDARKKLPAKLGDVVVSTAGELEYQKYIFHSITIDLDYRMNNHDTNSDYYSWLCQKMNIKEEDICKFTIRQSVHKCFQLVDVLGLKSIAFPTIGAGAARLDVAEVAENMAEEISQCLKITNRRIDVELYLYDTRNRTSVETYIGMFEAFAIRQAFIEHELQSAASQDVKVQRPSDFKKCRPEEMNHQVFISYSRKDFETANPIRQKLEEAGFKCWMDVEGYYSGQDYVDVIIEAIKRCRVVLFLSSANSNASINVYREIREAIAREKAILPLKLDQSPYSDRIAFNIRDYDFIEYQDNDTVFEKIRQNIALRIGTGN